MRIASCALGLVLLTAAAPLAADPVIEACVNKGNGAVRLVAPDVLCHAAETRVQWNVAGPAGPAGPQGPAGPAGPQGEPGVDGVNAGGPPYVVVCAPSIVALGNNSYAALHVFNGGTATANVSVHFLSKTGVNLAGVAVPGATPPSPGDPVPTYPGQSGAATVPIPPDNTLLYNWTTPIATPDLSGNIPTAIKVTSDQPVAVGNVMWTGGFSWVTCEPLPK
jgi:hypothetical protein